MTDQRADWDTAGRAVISTGLLYGAISVAGVVAVALSGSLPLILTLEAGAFVTAFVVMIVAFFWGSSLRRLADTAGHDPGRVTHGGLGLWALTLLLSTLLVLAGLEAEGNVSDVLLMTRMVLRVIGAIGLVAGVWITRSRLTRLLAGAPLEEPEQRSAEPTGADWDAGALDPAAREALERKRKIYYD